jgi:hypothetical protein
MSTENGDGLAYVIAKQVMRELNYRAIPSLIEHLADTIGTILTPMLTELNTLRRVVNNPVPKYDWSALPAQYLWAATDKNGSVFAYIDRPEKYVMYGNWNDQNCDSSKYVQLQSHSASNYLEWEDSLEARPCSPFVDTATLDLTKPMIRSGVDGTFEFIREVTGGYLFIHTSDDIICPEIVDSLSTFKNINEFTYIVYLVEDKRTHRQYLTQSPEWANIISTLVVKYNTNSGWTTTEINS